MLKAAFFAAAVLAPALAMADIADSGANGFTVKLQLEIAAPPQQVYIRLVHNVGDWWSPMHTFSGDSHKLTIEDKAMGCFCEKLPNGGSVRHLEVVNATPGKTLVMIGGLGPLQSTAVSGSLTIQLAPAAVGTKLDVQYAVAGYLPAGVNTWAAPVNSVLTEQFTRLKTFVETGRAPK
ncbi:MAG TPA: hypothetical protein VME17_23040 [Bryobacteraceae bacterium]|nr:hypothetical protein [Bryobacteraceae bacterium]